MINLKIEFNKFVNNKRNIDSEESNLFGYHHKLFESDYQMLKQQEYISSWSSVEYDKNSFDEFMNRLANDYKKH